MLQNFPHLEQHQRLVFYTFLLKNIPRENNNLIKNASSLVKLLYFCYPENQVFT